MIDISRIAIVPADVILELIFRPGGKDVATLVLFQTFPKFGSLIRIAKSSREGLIEANTTRHVISISDLEPGKNYKYWGLSKEILQFEPYEVIYGGSIASDIFEFRTLGPKKATFRFRVYQDIHGDQVKPTELFKQPGSDTSDLLFFNGDTLSFPDKEEVLFSGFLDFAVNRFAKNIPFVYIKGNHDTRGAVARRLGDYFPPRDGRYFYSFDHGPVHFVIMDSGEDKTDDSPVYAGLAGFDRYRQKEADWLQKEIQTEAFKRAAFRIVLFHMPPYGRGYGVENLTKLWGPLLNDVGADVVILGHTHRLYKIAPAPGMNVFSILGSPPDAAIWADVSAAKIDFKVVDIKGTTLETLALTPRKTK
jgi:predicted phosphodiesterase